MDPIDAHALLKEPGRCDETRQAPVREADRTLLEDSLRDGPMHEGGAVADGRSIPPSPPPFFYEDQYGSPRVDLAACKIFGDAAVARGRCF